MQGNVNNLNWIAGGWYLSGSIAFAIGGQLSDYFGRKGVVLAGQALLLVGHLVGALAQTFNQLIAAMVIIGTGTGLVFVVVTNSNMIVGDISGAVALVGTVFAYRPPRQVYIEGTKKDILLELDYVGLFMYTASISLLFLGLGWPGSGVPWNSAKVIAPIVTGGVILILTAVWDFSGIPKRPLFAPRLFRNLRGYASLLIVNFASGARSSVCTQTKTL